MRPLFGGADKETLRMVQHLRKLLPEAHVHEVLKHLVGLSKKAPCYQSAMRQLLCICVMLSPPLPSACIWVYYVAKHYVSLWCHARLFSQLCLWVALQLEEGLVQLLKSEEDDGCRYYLPQDAEHDYQQENMVFRCVLHAGNFPWCTTTLLLPQTHMMVVARSSRTHWCLLLASYGCHHRRRI